MEEIEKQEQTEAAAETLSDQLTPMHQDPFSLTCHHLTNIKDLTHLFFVSKPINNKVKKYLRKQNRVVEFIKGEVCYVVAGGILNTRGGIPVQNYTKNSIKYCQSWINDYVYGKHWGLSVGMLQSQLPFTIGGVDPRPYQLCSMRPGIVIEYGKIYIENGGNNENSPPSLKCTIPSNPSCGGSGPPEVDGHIRVRDRTIPGGYVPNGTWLIITTDDLPLLKGKVTPALNLDLLNPLFPEIMSFLSTTDLVESTTLRAFRTKQEAEAYAKTQVKTNDPNNAGTRSLPLISECIVKQDLRLGMECILDITDAEVNTVWRKPNRVAGHEPAHVPNHLPEARGTLLRVATVKPHNITFTDKAYPLGFEEQVIEDELSKKCVIS